MKRISDMKVMAQEKFRKKRICPICKTGYAEPPAISRRDGHTEICPDCGMKEAIEDYQKAKGGTR